MHNLKWQWPPGLSHCHLFQERWGHWNANRANYSNFNRIISTVFGQSLVSCGCAEDQPRVCSTSFILLLLSVWSCCSCCCRVECTSSWPQTHSPTCLYLKCWDYRGALPCPAPKMIWNQWLWFFVVVEIMVLSSLYNHINNKLWIDNCQICTVERENILYISCSNMYHVMS